MPGLSGSSPLDPLGMRTQGGWSQLRQGQPDLHATPTPSSPIALTAISSTHPRRPPCLSVVHQLAIGRCQIATLPSARTGLG